MKDLIFPPKAKCFIDEANFIFERRFKMKKQNQEKELTFGLVARMFEKLKEQGYSIEEIMTMPIYVK